jgi:hypothetical protein
MIRGEIWSAKCKACSILGANSALIYRSIELEGNIENPMWNLWSEGGLDTQSSPNAYGGRCTTEHTNNIREACVSTTDCTAKSTAHMNPKRNILSCQQDCDPPIHISRVIISISADYRWNPSSHHSRGVCTLDTWDLEGDQCQMSRSWKALRSTLLGLL